MIKLLMNNDGRWSLLASLVEQINKVLGYGGPGTTVRRKPIGGTWQAIAATSGTDTACTNGTMYVGRIYLPMPALVTGIQYLIGTVGGTNNVVVTLHDEAGKVLRSNAAAGTLVGTAANNQQVPFALDGEGEAATTIELPAGFYHIGLTFNGTTAKFRSVPAHTAGGSNLLGNGVAQTFGTIADITPPTTFTADKVPVASLY